MTDVGRLSAAPSRISIDLESPSVTAAIEATAGDDVAQLTLPLERSTPISEAAALEAATPPVRKGRAPLDWRGFFDREAAFVRKALGIAAGMSLGLAVAAGFGLRELNETFMQFQLPNTEGKVNSIFGSKMAYTAEPPHEYFSGRGQLLYVLTGETTEDDDKYTGLTDTIMVCLLDFNHNRVKVLSIPRDTTVHYGRRWGRINEAASIRGDLTALGEKVSDFMTVPVDNVVAVNYDGFRAVIDALGGVDVDVEKRMKYTDRAGGLTIDFEPGPQHLDGKAALEYARFRHDAEGDFGRIRRQQQIISELKQQKLNFGLIARLPKLLQAVQQSVRTTDELTYEQMRALVSWILSVPRSNIEFETIPTYGIMHYGASMQAPRYDATRDLLTRYFSDEPLNPVGPPAPDAPEDPSPL